MQKYCENLFQYQRRKTHEVMVGDVGIGGSNPIRIQSMTIADTMDTDAAVREVIQLAEAGCEIVRLTAPSIKEAENLREIKKRLRTAGVHVPLVADIHYTPNAALVAAEIVEKVRINPGNYADKKKFEVKEYTDAEYNAELERVYERFSPLVKKCKENGVAMRIGVNHGSLSDRIMNRYGDTPEGMVESALEFIRICEDWNYHDIVVSMKASNPQVMIQAYRLLAARMAELGMTYPFHLGVTEAGDGEDGRVKSAVGIGALLEDGIGDTIRVSLTEDAIHEIPVAKALVEKYNRRWKQAESPPLLISEEDYLQAFPPYQSNRRQSYKVPVIGAAIGGGEPVRVAVSADAKPAEGTSLRVLNASNGDLSRPEWLMGRAEVALNDWLPAVHFEDFDGAVRGVRIRVDDGDPAYPLAEILREAQKRALPVYAYFSGFAPGRFRPERFRERLQALIHACAGADYWSVIIGLEMPADTLGGVGNVRQAVGWLGKLGFNAPIVLAYRVPAGFANWQLDAAATLGSLMCDGIGDGVWIDGDVTAEQASRFAYILLQAARLRISKTEFISCPSCGRTLFNLQTTTERIKSKTGHLKGVKIAIMGCIVNGPGEMADADFGYVGAGPGKVNLFVGKECVERNIPESEADERLIELIRKHGKWVDP